jgi:aspartate kinase
LGRGGSDTTAVTLAGRLGADVCRIYTDVDGVYDKDPRVVADARKYVSISYGDMRQLCEKGAQVLHHKCVEAGEKYGVPIWVLSSFRDNPGTLVWNGPTKLV